MMKYGLKKDNPLLSGFYIVLAAVAFAFLLSFFRESDPIGQIQSWWDILILFCVCITAVVSAWMGWLFLSGNYPIDIETESVGICIRHRNGRERRYVYSDIAAVSYLKLHGEHGLVVLPRGGKAIPLKVGDESTARKIAAEIQKNLKNEDERAKMILENLPQGFEERGMSPDHLEK